MLLASVLGWLNLAAAAAGERPFMWEVQGRNGATVHLFGSIHLCRADCFPLPASVVGALDRADWLGVELDPTAAAVSEQLMARALYLGDDSLDRHLDAELMGELSSALQRFGLPPQAVLKMKPWMAGTTVTLLAAMAAGYGTEHGIDMWFVTRARQQGKPVIELETVDQQVDSLERLSPQQQRLLVLQAVRLLGGGGVKPYLDDMVDAWRGGDGERLYRLSAAGLEDAAQGARLLQALVAQRNRAMAQRIAERMSKPGRGFVVVGAMHLAGPGSIPELLRAAGFSVRQVGR
jgi:uncharacterized protein YbaP (TraB family)